MAKMQKLFPAGDFISSETLTLSKLGFLLTPTGLLVNITTQLSPEKAHPSQLTCPTFPGLTGLPAPRIPRGGASRETRCYDLAASPGLDTATEPGQEHSQRKVPLRPRLLEKETGHVPDKINHHRR